MMLLKMDLALSTGLEESHKTHTTPSVTDRLTSEAGLDTMGHFIVTKDSIKLQGAFWNHMIAIVPIPNLFNVVLDNNSYLIKITSLMYDE